ncbi:PucR family transcriptional regulator [Jeotgalibacillus soli]|uniref:PucR family transcriptional regulator n=1 Tax=Jeotgalibacillus soli TaxID=889306 RepID=A0A0C2VKH5_9BACL|nr:PucR family transcriptional regulator [Jeotgalibacillus soli]KIL49402.1 hypothetical protein KP78_08700 [Jeotgalibacillus soli]
MKVADALNIGVLSTATVIAGINGLEREIKSIEVMEVPEVGSWATEGILMMTTFYSVKDDFNKQYEILKTLIEKKAAGMVIKLGRFIEQLPKEMIELAEQGSFPIISISKNVSYINVLSPLYEQLYEEKKKITQNDLNPFHEFIDEEHANVAEAIESLSKVVGSQVYIEGSEGSLLYCSDTFSSDGWRNSDLLLSKPVHPDYKLLVKKWRTELQHTPYKRVKFSDQRHRLIVPIFSKKLISAFIHLPYKNESKFQKIESRNVEIISRKLSEAIMSEQLDLQKERIEDMEVLESLLEYPNYVHDDRMFTLLFFTVKNNQETTIRATTLLDTNYLVRKKIKDFISPLPFEQSMIFEKHQHFFVLIQNLEKNNQLMLSQLELALNKSEKNSFLGNMHISVSSPFKDLINFDDKIKSVTKIMEVGFKVRPDNRLYAYNHLGIYEIIFNISSDPFAESYAKEVLSPILNDEGQLLETLVIFLNENGNVSRASEKLFVHRRTMTYRLQKIKELLNMELDDAENLFILRFCLKMKELL